MRNIVNIKIYGMKKTLFHFLSFMMGLMGLTLLGASPAMAGVQAETIVIGAGDNLVSKMTAENVCYEITGDIDMGGATCTVPAGCTLRFKGGSLYNGTLVGTWTRLDYTGDTEGIFGKITFSGDYLFPKVSTKMFKDPSFANSIKRVFALTSDSIHNDVTIEALPDGGVYSLIFDGNVIVDMHSKTSVTLNGDMKINPTSSGSYDIFRINKKDSVSFKGTGSIIGDRDEHTGTDGEWGMGIGIYTSTNVTLSGITVSKCWGDCVYIGGTSTGELCENVTIDHCKLTGSRRQGVSVVAGRNVHITNTQIEDIYGTDPQAAIDIEPNDNQTCENIYIKNVVAKRCKNGIAGYAEHDSQYNVTNRLLRNMNIDSCDIQSQTLSLNADGVYGLNVTNSTFSLGTDTAAGYAMLRSRDANITVKNCTFKGTDTAYPAQIGVLFLEKDTVALEGNTFDNLASFSSFVYGTWAAANKGCKIVSNKINAPVDLKFDGCTFSDNRVVGDTTTLLRIYAGGNNVLERDTLEYTAEGAYKAPATIYTQVSNTTNNTITGLVIYPDALGDTRAFSKGELASSFKDGDLILLNNATTHEARNMYMRAANKSVTSGSETYYRAYVDSIYGTGNHALERYIVQLVQMTDTAAADGNKLFKLWNPVTKRYYREWMNGDDATIISFTSSGNFSLDQATPFEILPAKQYCTYFTDNAGYGHTPYLPDESKAIVVMRQNGDQTYFMGSEWNAGYVYYGTDKDRIMWNPYAVTYQCSAWNNLKTLVQAVEDTIGNLTAGTELDALKSALSTARDSVYSLTSTNEGFNAQTEALEAAFKAAKEASTPEPKGYRLAGRAYPYKLKAGDVIGLRNATCDAGQNLWFSNATVRMNDWGQQILLGTIANLDTIMDNNYLFELVASGKTGPLHNNPTFLLKSKGSGLYLRTQFTNGGEYKLSYTDDASVAADFEFAQAKDSCTFFTNNSSWKQTTTIADDTTLVMMHVDESVNDDYNASTGSPASGMKNLYMYIGPQWTSKNTLYGYWFKDAIMWNAYYAKYDGGEAYNKLSALAETISADTTIVAGKHVGEYPATSVTALTDALTAAQTLLANVDTTDEAYTAGYDALKAVYDSVKTTVIKYIKGYVISGRAFPADLKNGDVIALNNATIDGTAASWAKVYGQYQWLNSNKFTRLYPTIDNTDYYQKLSIERTDTAGAMDENFLLQLEEAADGAPILGGKSFYLKNVASGKYLKAWYSNAGEYGINAVDSKDDATAFEFGQGKNYSTYWTDNSSYAHTPYMADDTTLVVMNQGKCSTSPGIGTAPSDSEDHIFFIRPDWNRNYATYGFLTPDAIIWNAYYAKYTNGAAWDNLKSLADEISAANIVAGKHVGEYPAVYVNALNIELASAQALLAVVDTTDEAYTDEYGKLKAAYDSVKVSVITRIQGYVISGRAFPADLKNGDVIALNNATIDGTAASWAKVYGQYQWLNSNKFTRLYPTIDNTDYYQKLSIERTDTAGAMDENFLLQLEEAADGAPILGGKSFYLKNVASGKYLKAWYSNAGEYGINAVDSKDDATAFEFGQGKNYSTYWTDNSSYAHTPYMADDTTLVVMNQGKCSTSPGIGTAPSDSEDHIFFIRPDWNRNYATYGFLTPDAIIWNAYYAKYTKGAAWDKLNALTKLVNDSIGLYTPAEYKRDALTTAQSMLSYANNFLAVDTTDEAYNLTYETLNFAYNALKSSRLSDDEIYYLAGRIYPYDLKDGDVIALRNATCDDAQNLWLNNGVVSMSQWSQQLTLGNIADPTAPIDGNYLFELVASGKTGPLHNNPTYLLKSKGSGLYIRTQFTNGGELKLSYTDDPSVAADFEFAQAKDSCTYFTDNANWKQTTTIADDTTLVMMHLDESVNDDYNANPGSPASGMKNLYMYLGPQWKTKNTLYGYWFKDMIMWNAYRATTKAMVVDIDKNVTGTTEYVNVYNVDGVLIKRHVKADTATEGLEKGIYIVGGKKVLVK